MKIYRGPQSTEEASVTDEKNAAEIGKNWAPGETIVFDGTIDKSGVRHTSIGIEIEEADIVALTRAFLRHRDSGRRELIHQLTEAHEEEVNGYREAFVKLINLSHKIVDAPSKQEFAEAMRAVVDHYDRFNVHDPERPPDLKWVKWSEI